MGTTKLRIHGFVDGMDPDRVIACASCNQEEPKLRHIDFEMDCDRGWTYGDDGTKLKTMDDLIICENCVKEGASLLGLVDAEELKEHNSTLLSEREEALKEKEKAQNYADRLEELLTQAREKPIHIDSRQRPRQVA